MDGEGRVGMFIKKLRPEEKAPATADRVCIDRLPDGHMTWNGSVIVGGAPVRGGGRKFSTVQEAETDAINWARGHGTSQLLIDVSYLWPGS
jgi:hypothetical protein